MIGFAGSFGAKRSLINDHYLMNELFLVLKRVDK